MERQHFCRLRLRGEGRHHGRHIECFPPGHTTTTGQTITFTDAVTSTFGPQPVSGLVQFLVDGAVTGAVSLNASGKAIFTTTLATGPHTVTAVYNAHNNYASNTSNALTYTAALAALGTAPPSGEGSISFAQSTTTATKPATPPSAANLDAHFASPTTPNSTRTLAGALAKVHSEDDWLGGSF